MKMGKYCHTVLVEVQGQAGFETVWIYWDEYLRGLRA